MILWRHASAPQTLNCPCCWHCTWCHRVIAITLTPHASVRLQLSGEETTGETDLERCSGSRCRFWSWLWWEECWTSWSTLNNTVDSAHFTDGTMDYLLPQASAAVIISTADDSQPPHLPLKRSLEAREDPPSGWSTRSTFFTFNLNIVSCLLTWSVWRFLS